MQKSIITIILLIIALLLVVKLKNFIKNNQPTPTPPITENENGGGTACTMDAMMCPDGSYVGRSGPMCEFVCPEVTATSTLTSRATLGLNDTFEINGLLIKPWALLEDSRCPSDVVCIQAGRAVVALNVGSSTMEIEIGHTKKIGILSITLDDVMPYPVSTRKTADQEYRFAFTFKLN